MELIKRTIHMNRGGEVLRQVTLEEDMNIPDVKPDVESLCLEKGELLLDETKQSADTVTLKGRMVYSILYRTTEEGGRLVDFTGEIPFEEVCHVSPRPGNTYFSAEGEVEDLSIHMINSRKLGLQCLLNLTLLTEEEVEEEIPVGLSDPEGLEYCYKQVTTSETVIHKNDVFRIRKEVFLPAGYSNIGRILWSDLTLGDVEIRPEEEKLILRGELHLFVLYEGEGENHPVRFYESTVTFQGELECHGCDAGMIPDIPYRLGHVEIAVRPDIDGEERIIGVEVTLEIPIRLYREETYQMLSDLYGVTREVSKREHKVSLPRFIAKVLGKTKVTGHILLPHTQGVLQVLHSKAALSLDEKAVEQGGIRLKGNLQVKVMYITGEDRRPYDSVEGNIPFEYFLEIPDFTEGEMGRLRAGIEQLSVSMVDGQKLDVKAVLLFDTTAFDNLEFSAIDEVTVDEIDREKYAALAGISIVVAKQGDTLWSIGEKYFQPVEKIKELNGLAEDTIHPGQKLLIVL